MIADNITYSNIKNIQARKIHSINIEHNKIVFHNILISKCPNLAARFIESINRRATVVGDITKLKGLYIPVWIAPLFIHDHDDLQKASFIHCALYFCLIMIDDSLDGYFHIESYNKLIDITINNCKDYLPPEKQNKWVAEAKKRFLAMIDFEQNQYSSAKLKNIDFSLKACVFKSTIDSFVLLSEITCSIESLYIAFEHAIRANSYADDIDDLFEDINQPSNTSTLLYGRSSVLDLMKSSFEQLEYNATVATKFFTDHNCVEFSAFMNSLLKGSSEARFDYRYRLIFSNLYNGKKYFSGT